MPAFTPPPPVAVQLLPAQGVGFDGSVLGQSLETWRAAQTQSACAAPVGVVTTCTLPAVNLGDGNMARDLVFEFVDGRLARIRFLTSIDAYQEVRALLDPRLGAPHTIQRNAIHLDESVDTAHLRDSWTLAGATVILNDPERDGVSLSVTFALDSLAGRLKPEPA